MCAGKTGELRQQRYEKEKHPRVCGEDGLASALLVILVETPPCVRGRPEDYVEDEIKSRNTPVCAGKTFSLFYTLLNQRKHPRVCGEDSRLCGGSVDNRETPPCVRGRQPK